MASQSKENYLKALFHLDKKSKDISVTELGNVMKVKKSSVNNMVKKLATLGWLQQEKYKPIKLTAKGRKEAALIIRKHRLTEMFLVNKMGFGWEEVHDIAEQMEHIKSPLLFDKMDTLLGSPMYDPHGSPIPTKEGKIIKSNFTPLNSFSVHETVVLKALTNSNKEFLEYLNTKDLKLGKKIIIHSIEPFDKSMIVSYGKHKNVVLSQKICNQLMCINLK
jgi:DtxR family Mn-dependent transcriptional regulator